MDTYRSAVAVVIVLSGLVVSETRADTATDRDVSERIAKWQKALVREKDVWKYLVYCHRGMAPPDKNASMSKPVPRIEQRWKQIKSAIVNSVAKRPESPYADDASLVIAIGIAHLEKNKPEAIKRLKEIARQDPKSGCILGPYIPYGWPKLDEVWVTAALMTVPRRTWSTDTKNLGRQGRPTSIKLPKNFRERAAVFYAAHLVKYPKSTKSYALACLAYHPLREGHLEDALKQLEKLFDADRNIQKIGIEDRKASSRPEGYHIYRIQRPVVMAARWYLYVCKSKGLIDKGTSVGATIVSRISGDGWYWDLNMYLAEIYKRKAKGSKSPEAAKQFGLALQGYRTYMRKEGEFAKACYGTLRNLPLKRWEKQILELKKSILEMGGKADLKKDEFADIKAIFVKKQEPLPQGLSKASVLARLRVILSDEAKYPGPKDRVRGAEEVVKWFLLEVKKAGPNKRNEVIQARRELMVGLATLGMYEADATAKKSILSCAGGLVTYRPSKERFSREKLAELKQNVGTLVQDITKAKEKDKDADVGALREDLVKLPEESIRLIAEHLLDPKLPVDAKIVISHALWNRSCPAALPLLLKIIETAPNSSITRAGVSGIKAILDKSQIDEKGVITGPRETLRPRTATPASTTQRAKRFRFRKGAEQLIIDKRSPQEDKLRANLLACMQDENKFSKIQDMVNRRWDKTSIKYLGSLLMEDWDKKYGESLRRPKAIAELLMYVQAHEKLKGFLDDKVPVATFAERERVAEVRRETPAALDAYYRVLLNTGSRWPSQSRKDLQYHVTYALLIHGTPEMVTETIWEGMAGNDKFRFDMLGVLGNLCNEDTSKRLSEFSRSRSWPEKDQNRIAMAMKYVARGVGKRKIIQKQNKGRPADPAIVICEEERKLMEHKLALMRAGKGVPIKGVGSMAGSAVMRDLAVKYVKVNGVILMACRPATTELTAVGYFVNAKDRELLVLDGPISEQAKKLHGKKWDFLEPETHVLASGRGIAICVNSMNKLGSLTVQQVRHLFSKKTSSWREVTGAEVKIKRYGLAGTDPAARVFYSRINPPAACARPDTRLGTQAVLAALSRDPHGIAFVDAAAANDLLGAAKAKSGIKVLSIGAPFDKLRTSKGKATSPTSANVKAGKYPISQQLTLHLSPRASQTTRDFVKFVLSGAADEVFTKHGLTPAPRPAAKK